MPDLAKLYTHSGAIILALRSAGLTVFDSGPPTNTDQDWGWVDVPGQSAYRPYVILYDLPGGEFDGPLGCPDDDASLIWQATCIAETAERCRWLTDKAVAALVGQQIPVEGRSICRLYADFVAGAVRRDDTVQPPVYISTPRFRATSTPA